MPPTTPNFRPFFTRIYGNAMLDAVVVLPQRITGYVSSSVSTNLPALGSLDQSYKTPFVLGVLFDPLPGWRIGERLVARQLGLMGRVLQIAFKVAGN